MMIYTISTEVLTKALQSILKDGWEIERVLQAGTLKVEVRKINPENPFEIKDGEYKVEDAPPKVLSPLPSTPSSSVFKHHNRGLGEAIEMVMKKRGKLFAGELRSILVKDYKFNPDKLTFTKLCGAVGYSKRVVSMNKKSKSKRIYQYIG